MPSEFKISCRCILIHSSCTVLNRTSTRSGSYAPHSTNAIAHRVGCPHAAKRTFSIDVGPVRFVLLVRGETPGNKLSHFDPNTGTFQEWLIPTNNANPFGLAITSTQGSPTLWGTEFSSNKIFVFSPAQNVLREYLLPHPEAVRSTYLLNRAVTSESLVH